MVLSREIEQRRLDLQVDALDIRWARRVAERVGRIGEVLLTLEGEDLRMMGELALALRSAMALRGAAPAGGALAGVPRFAQVGTPAELALSQGARILGQTSDPRTQLFATALAASGEEPDVGDYALEVVVTALLEAAGADDDWQAHEAELEALDAARGPVTELPRQTGGEARYLIVREEQTIEDIAHLVMGGRGLWTDFVERYGLQPPYVSPTPRGGCLTPGQRVPLPPLHPTQRDEGRLGATLAVDASADDWDLVTSGAGDLVIIGGLEGLASDLGLRTATPLGDLPDERDYGKVVVAGLPASESGLVEAAMLAESLYNDPRVGQVKARAAAGTSAITGLYRDEVVIIPRPELMGG